jgi:hypothetical protein
MLERMRQRQCEHRLEHMRQRQCEHMLEHMRGSTQDVRTGTQHTCACTETQEGMRGARTTHGPARVCETAHMSSRHECSTHLLADADEEIARDDELVARLDARARPHLVLPLARHHLQCKQHTHTAQHA